jgi:nucleoside-diphosphate-sugar epimerase
MKALFIGGTGTISAAITRRLVKEMGWEVWLLNRGSRPEAVPEAYAEFCRLPFKHSEGGDTAKKLWVAETQTATTRDWAIFFRESYGKALKLAQEGK